MLLRDHLTWDLRRATTSIRASRRTFRNHVQILFGSSNQRRAPRNNNNAIAVQLLYIDALDTQENKAGEVLCCQPIGWLLVNAGDSWVRTGHVVLLDSDKVDKKEPWIVLAKEWQKTPCNEYCACDRGCDSTHEGEEDSSQPEQAPDIADVSTTSHTPEQGSLPGDLIYTTVTKLIFPEIDDLLQYGEPQDICLQNHGQRWHNNHLQTCLAKLHG